MQPLAGDIGEQSLLPRPDKKGRHPKVTALEARYVSALSGLGVEGGVHGDGAGDGGTDHGVVAHADETHHLDVCRNR